MTWLKGKRTALLRCRECRVGSLPSPLHHIVGQRRHFRLGCDMSTLDCVHWDLKLLPQSLATEAVAEMPEGGVRHAGSSVVALATLSVATEGVRAHEPAAHHTPILAESATIKHLQGRAEHREVLSAGTANICGRLSFQHASDRHGRIGDEVHFVRECCGRSEGRFAEVRGGADATLHTSQCSWRKLVSLSGPTRMPRI